MAKRLLSTQKIVNLIEDPLSGTSGEVYYNSVSNKLRIYNGLSWSDVDTNDSGSAIFVGDIAPSSPTTGNQWYNSNTGILYIYYDNFWVQVGGSDSPKSNSFYKINVPNGTSPTAESELDILTVMSSNGINIIGDSSNDSIEFATDATFLNIADKIVKRDENQSFDISSIDFESAQITAKNQTISVTTPVLIDSFSISGYRGAEYTFQFSQNNADFVISKIILIHNGTDVAITEYGNVSIGNIIEYDFNGSFSLGNLELTLTCSNANVLPVNIKFTRTLIQA